MPTLLIADDHPLFRAALRQAAADAVPETVVREAGTLDDALAALEAEPGIDLVLPDLPMPGNHGLAGLAAIRASNGCRPRCARRSRAPTASAATPTSPRVWPACRRSSSGC